MSLKSQGSVASRSGIANTSGTGGFGNNEFSRQLTRGAEEDIASSRAVEHTPSPSIAFSSASTSASLGDNGSVAQAWERGLDNFFGELGKAIHHSPDPGAARYH